MGMFDYVRCEASIPNPEVMDDDNRYQTKDTECLLDEYRIDRHGQLWVRFFDPFEATLKDEETISNFNGIMNFYGHTLANGRWKEYRARFLNGVMQSVEIERP